MQELSQCDTLSSLSLYGVRLPKTGLQGLGRLKNLTELTIVESPVTDADLSEIKQLRKLTRLYLSTPRSAITNAGLKQLRPLKDLIKLDLGYAHITDDGLKELNGFTKLTILSLNDTPITDAGVRQLAPRKNLIDLNLGQRPESRTPRWASYGPSRNGKRDRSDIDKMGRIDFGRRGTTDCQ